MKSGSSNQATELAFIWATRGKTWGFRFLRTAGQPNPLELYEKAFQGEMDAPETFQTNADTIAIRVPDPEGRRDAAGRVIPHEFVLFKPLPREVISAEEAFQLVWPEVKEDFARDWDQPKPKR
ncbi:hypothetical protein [Paenarthrobacter sp. NCHU4564]|uniref:hypothetical protein n=1 Tax=Paenarthrobacter sp. NCHU4564 TaxID=3451353 RepID=UPI003F9E78D2